MIIWKNLNLPYEFREAEPMIKACLWLAEEAAGELGFLVRVTSIHRPDDPSWKIHFQGPPYRALDLTLHTHPQLRKRAPDMNFMWAGARLEEYINARMKYGLNSSGTKELSVAWWHDAGSGYHLHLQSPPAGASFISGLTGGINGS